MIKKLSFIPALLAFVLHPAIATAGEGELLTPEDAAMRVKNGDAVLIDIREPSEWEESGVVSTAHLLPMSDLNGDRKLWNAFLKEHPDSELILYCRSGGRAGRAADTLAKEGFQTANGGGLADWIAAEQPLRKADEPPEEPANKPTDE
jgi:rhodanese-related sulfurtransferase